MGSIMGWLSKPRCVKLKSNPKLINIQSLEKDILVLAEGRLVNMVVLQVTQVFVIVAFTNQTLAQIRIVEKLARRTTMTYIVTKH
jgi:S-adenosylhomocysteine hydrolase